MICVLPVSYTHLDVYKRQMDIRTKDAAVGHEAKIGSISDDAVFYLMSRGMTEEDARALLVSGFADNVSCLLYTSRCV